MVFEIEDSFGVYGYTHKTSFEVKVRTCAVSGASAEGDRLSGFDALVGLNEETRKVTINGFHTIVVAKNYVETIAAAFVFGQSHFTAESRSHGVANRKTEVDAVVHAAETRAIAVARCYASYNGHVIFRNVENLSVRYHGIAISVNFVAFPTFCIDIEFGFLFVFVV